MIRNIIAVLLVIFLTGPVKTRKEPSVSGTISDIRTGEALAGVHVVYGRQPVTISDEKNKAVTGQSSQNCNFRTAFEITYNRLDINMIFLDLFA